MWCTWWIHVSCLVTAPSETIHVHRLTCDIIYRLCRIFTNIPFKYIHWTYHLPMSVTSTQVTEYIFKVVLIGDLGTGKSSIVERCVNRTYRPRNVATIGVDFAVKTVDWDPRTRIKLQLWDISGRERFADMTRVYYKEAVGALLVLDITNDISIDTVLKWKADLDKKAVLPNNETVPCLLLANKCDLSTTQWKLDESGLKDLCSRCGCFAWLATSAKKDVHILDAERTILKKILDMHPELEKYRDRETKVFLTEEDFTEKSSKCC